MEKKKVFIIIGIIVILCIAFFSAVLLRKSNNETKQEDITFSEYEMASIKAVADYKNKIKNPHSLEVFEIRVYKKNATDIIFDCKEIIESGKEERKLVEYGLESDGNVKYLVNTSKAGQTSTNFGEQLEITIANAVKEEWDNDTDYTSIDKEKVLNNLDKANSENNSSSKEVKDVDFSQLEQAISNKNLINAVNEHSKISKMNKSKEDTEKFATITNDLQALKDERKAELLNKVDSSYDDMTQQTQYYFKGFEEYQKKCVNEAFDKGEKVIVQPHISRDEGKNNTDFYMTFMLLKDSWIFFEDIIFNVDGELTNISKSNIEKYTEVIGNGLVSETAGMYLQKYSMFNELMEKIISGNEIKIRLVGKDAKGNVDFTLTETDKENSKNLYELSLCL